MVNFVKPNLLGTRREFSNRFVNPITNGQHKDSTSRDVKIMKRRAHVLHEMLNDCVQVEELYVHLQAWTDQIQNTLVSQMRNSHMGLPWWQLFSWTSLNISFVPFPPPQRRDYSCLTKLLPTKHEYIISVRLSELQIELYQKYLDLHKDHLSAPTRGASLFSDYQTLMRIWTHPWVLKLEEARQAKKVFVLSNIGFWHFLL